MTGSPSLPFTSLLPHRTLPNGDDQTIVDNVMSLPMFDGEQCCVHRPDTAYGINKIANVLSSILLSLPPEHDSPVDYTPLVVQPECLPENGSHMLLKFT